MPSQRKILRQIYGLSHADVMTIFKRKLSHSQNQRDRRNHSLAKKSKKGKSRQRQQAVKEK